MERFGKFMIFCNITLVLIVLVSGLGVAEDRPIETYLSPDVAVVANLSQVSNQIDVLRGSELFKILGKFHAEDHPDKPPLATEFDKLPQHPIWQFVKNQLVLGVVAPKEQGAQPIFMLLVKVDGDQLANVEAFLKEEEKQEKGYRLPDEEYQGHKIIASLHPDKGKLQKRFVMMTPGLLIVSNVKERAMECYDRVVGQKEDGLKLPEIYQKLNPKAIFKVAVIMGNIKLDLEKLPHNPVESFPVMAQFFGHLRQALTGTRYLAGALFFENGLRLQVVRERNDAVPALLPMLSFPAAALDSRTIAFVALPIPYQIFWFGAKHDGQKHDPRKVREVESRLNELFDWLSFEMDVLPKIGPQTAIMLRNPQKMEGSPVVPHLQAVVQLGSGIEFAKAVDKVLQFVLQNREIGKHVKHQTQYFDKIPMQQFSFSNTPLDKFISPAYAFYSNRLVIGSSRQGIEEVLAFLKSPQELRQDHFYLHLNFTALADLLQANLSFFRQETVKKGEPFSDKKAGLFLDLLHLFQDLSARLSSRGNLETLDVVLQAK